MNFFREEITIGISMIFAILIMIFLHKAIEIEEKNKAKKKTFSKGKRVISVVFTVIISLVIISIIGGLGIHTIYKNSKKVGSSNQTTSSDNGN